MRFLLVLGMQDTTARGKFHFYFIIIVLKLSSIWNSVTTPPSEVKYGNNRVVCLVMISCLILGSNHKLDSFLSSLLLQDPFIVLDSRYLGLEEVSHLGGFAHLGLVVGFLFGQHLPVE